MPVYHISVQSFPEFTLDIHWFRLPDRNCAVHSTLTPLNMGSRIGRGVENTFGVLMTG